ncbi:peptidase M23 [Streptomyces erythrochromogenes]|uniref:peptidase M23 n=1 Tax=Streptomyces erythrochromogenes TaxID=285574 RepID=UPI003681E889
MNTRQAVMMASGVARRGAMLKIVIPAAVLFFVFLVALGIVASVAGSSQASVAACGDAGQPDTQYDDGDDSGGGTQGGGRPSGSLRAQQIANARIIDGEAAAAGLSGRATLIALMTALQESTLINLDHGDRDSVGLFQQRTSTGWGTIQQIMDPHYSSKMFLLGKGFRAGDNGDPPGLTDIQGWDTMPMGDAAQKVQRSAYPTLYTGQESEARRIAHEAGLDLDRGGNPAPTGTGSASGAPQPPNYGTYPSGYSSPPSSERPTQGMFDRCEGKEFADRRPTSSPGEPGEKFHDGNAPWPAEVKNRRSTEDAIAWARREAEHPTDDWFRWCLRFTATSYGWTSAGSGHAIDHYWSMPPSMRHAKDRNPPPGALLYWRTDSRSGHVALFVGDGMIASNDIREKGKISIVPAEEIERKWGAVYEGWAPPYFPNGG